MLPGSEFLSSPKRIQNIIRIILVALLPAAPVQAQNKMFMSGNELYVQCKGPDELVCSGFVMGVSDAVAAYQASGAIRSLICLPEGTHTGDLISAVVRYLEEKPELRRQRAVSVVVGAMLEAFPCQR